MRFIKALGKALLAFVAITILVLVILFLTSAAVAGPAWAGPVIGVSLMLGTLTFVFYQEGV